MASSADMPFSYVAVYVAPRTRVRGCLLAQRGSLLSPSDVLSVRRPGRERITRRSSRQPAQ
ncbi:hypothetical protein M433DRAFT_10633 [Acidomyces richmondensis BFW]|nr:hypothetical protein M433DRAFT_10633 [Acidomyces richmondensis BFW]